LKGNNPSEVVQSCDITFASVSDTAALKDVCFLLSAQRFVTDIVINHNHVFLPSLCAYHK